MAAFQSTQGGIQYVEPMQQRAIRLMEKAQPRANMPVVKARSHINWALGSLEEELWQERLVTQRVADLKESDTRLRTMAGAESLEITPYTPPDILGLCVATLCRNNPVGPLYIAITFCGRTPAPHPVLPSH